MLARPSHAVIIIRTDTALAVDGGTTLQQ